MRKNPNFDYRAFLSQKEELVDLISKWSYGVEGALGIESKIKDLLRSSIQTFELMSFLSPFYLERLVYSLHSIVVENNKIIYSDITPLAEMLCQAFITEYKTTLKDRVIAWIVSSITSLYNEFEDKDKLTKSLNEITHFYNVQVSADQRFNFNFASGDFEELEQELSEQVTQKRKQIFELYTYKVGEKNLKIYVYTNFGYLGYLLSHFFLYRVIYNAMSENIDSDIFDLFGFFEYRISKSQIEFKFQTEYPHVCFYDLMFKSKNVPMWYHTVLDGISFFTETIHLTNIDLKDKILTADDVQTSTINYKMSPISTHNRQAVFSPISRLESSCAIVFSWAKSVMCNKEYLQYKNMRGMIDSKLFFYGKNAIFLFSKASLQVYKLADDNLQMITLLQEVEEAIPCVVERVPQVMAYIGKIDTKTPLFEIDEIGWDSKKTEFICYVFDLFCAYLKSELYSPSYNINETLKK